MKDILFKIETFNYKTWFAWYPVKTDTGWKWLQRVLRHTPPILQKPDHEFLTIVADHKSEFTEEIRKHQSQLRAK